ncbi:sialidase family protein [Paenibacillus flagellatus]|uniref:exo-alpha-sialidase n=1 Tax=Paenibacillus flagellatus TaxID=2211139 RepID=A0A2V5KCV4_9BACL|nr:sialidase family protein [Paenibacillus flagellatus]PYI57378.1 exo-alpha-sialidase [Paenibacillus flagellatus]
MTKQDLFAAGEHGYHTYRIPSLLVTREGTVLAFCEARRNGAGDAGDIDIVLRRSADHGATWGPWTRIADDGANTIGNPCAVQDRETGTIWLLLCRNAEDGHEKDILAGTKSRDVLVMRSDDDGLTWTAPRDITADVKRPGWTWYATGPCHAAQLRSGRLIVPCNHAVLDPETGTSGPYTAHVIYSDDHGGTWRIGGIVGAYTNECALAELPDGTVYLNMRSYHGRNRRAVSRSLDGGLTWSPIELDEALVEPVCQGSVIEDGRGGLLFANPASEKRERLTVRASADGGRSWTVQRVLHEGPAAYSDLAVAKDGSILCLYECGEERPYERMTLARYVDGR